MNEVKKMQTQQRFEAIRRVREVQPLGMRVLVQIKKDDNKSETGLYLPEGAKQAQQESLLAEVVEVATAQDEEENLTNISGIPLGAMVLIYADAGVKVPWNDSLRLVETADVLAIVDELELI